MDGMLFISVLTICALSPDSSADRQAIRAYLKQTGIESQVRRYERQYIPEEVRFYVGNAAFISRTIVDKQITIQWSFP